MSIWVCGLGSSCLEHTAPLRDHTWTFLFVLVGESVRETGNEAPYGFAKFQDRLQLGPHVSPTGTGKKTPTPESRLHRLDSQIQKTFCGPVYYVTLKLVTRYWTQTSVALTLLGDGLRC